ncbi:hypothetical protein [Nocardia mexicana]|uniref:Uncharacterized protein n=1 Tax=Nocardia mexicana TaxID=279262 RepID=A0A370GYF7_9NOCA|nr:hypothetical protein [Nocardia mexicana]RDI48529.1 hypothetical protein DFR68_108362 [Nocardia mexicana]
MKPLSDDTKSVLITAGAMTVAGLGTAGFLMFGPHHESHDAPVRPAAVSAPVETTVPQPVPECLMFCHEPAAPPVAADGCRLFCELGTGSFEEVMR